MTYNSDKKILPTLNCKTKTYFSGMLAAGVLGGIIGLQAGCIWWGIQWATGMNKHSTNK